MKRVKYSRKSHRFMGRLLAGMTAVAVFASSLAVPGNTGMVYAKETGTSDPVFKEPEVRSVNLNIDGRIAGLEDPTVPESTEAEWSNGTGTYIYYAGIGRSRLLDADATDFGKEGERSIFAVSDGQVDRDIFYRDQKADNGQKHANDWKYSDMYLYLTGETGIESPNTYYADNIAGRLFSKAQMAALISNYNDSHKDWEETSGGLAYAGLDGEKLFLLDAREIEYEEYGFSHTHEGSKSQFFKNGAMLLRSPSLADDMKAGITWQNPSDPLKHDVTARNLMDNAGVVYPAYNIRLSSVFYMAYKEDDVPADTNLEVKEHFCRTKEKGNRNEWTVSIFDGNEGFHAERNGILGTLKPGEYVYIRVTDKGQAGEGVQYDRISAMLVDESGTVIAYGKIGSIEQSLFMAQLPTDLKDGTYTLKIFAEDMLYEKTMDGDSKNPAGSVVSNTADIGIEVDSRDKTDVMFWSAPEPVVYSGKPLAIPENESLNIMNACYEDIEFSWYKDGVDEEKRLQKAPRDVGTYYLKADIFETEERQSSSAVNGPFIITPKTVTPYIEGSISKIYDGSDSIEGGDSTLSIRLDGAIENDKVSADGKIRYADSEIGTNKSIIAEDIEITGADRDNYILSSDTATADIGTIGKRAYPLNIPQSWIDAANTVRTVSDSMVLPDGWEWKNEDGDKKIPAGDSVVATAEYTGDDRETYQTTSVAVTITREACTEDMTVRFDGAGDYEPTCTEQGKGHTICSVCGDVMRDSVTVDAKEHSWNEGEVIHEATCQKEGEKVFSCNSCGETRTERLAKTDHISGAPIKENPVNAGCTESGSYDEAVYCESCHQELSRKKIEVAASGHSLSKVAEKAATASETGYREHWACSKCGKLFSDKDASAEITILDVTIPKLDGQETSGTGNNGNSGVDDNSKPSPSKPDDNPVNPTQPPSDENGGTKKPSDGKDTPDSSQPGGDKKPSQNPAGDNGTPLPNPSDNGGTTPAPSPSLDNGDADKDKTEGEGTDEGKAKTDAGQGKTDTEDGNNQENKPRPRAGEQFKDADTNAAYTVLSVSGRTAAYVKPLDKKQKTIVIPATVSINGVKYKITAIADSAFKGNKNVTKVKIGSGITKIGKNVFYGCRNLKTVTIGKNAVEIGAKAFYKCTSLTKVTIPAKVRKIGKLAFCGCWKLKLVDVRTKKLTDKKVGAKAFMNIHKKARIKVPTAKRKAYKKLFRAKGVTGKNQVIK